MLDKLTTHTAYKTCALIGSLIVILMPYVAWQYISDTEDRVLSVLEQDVLTKLDLESMKIQYQLIQNAISASQSNSNNPNAVDYSESELEHLQAESLNLRTQIESLALDLGTVEATKKAIIWEVKLIAGLCFIIMLLAMLIAAYGYLGWYFHIRIYQERRSEFGESRVTDQ